MRKKELEGRGAALMDALDDPRAKKFQRTEPPRPRREIVEDFADDEDTAAFLRAAGKNRRLRRGLIPQTKWGRIAAGACVLAFVGVVAGGLWGAMRWMSHDARFRIASSQEIQLDGNSHVSRAQMLSIFGEDVERNIFHVPLSQRRAELENLPWVEHATVMRLMPNRIRVHVVERVPVAYVRQGSEIDLVDAHGVILGVPADAAGNPAYSFPVVTGIKAEEPLSTRASRMKMYSKFIAELDGGGEKISSSISEVDLSDPEDMRALVPVDKGELLVHFGQENFLDRYHRMKEHVAEWRAQYPRLQGVDMRYDRQAVLQMPPGTEGNGGTAAPAAARVETKPAIVEKAAGKPVETKPAAVVKPVVAAHAAAVKDAHAVAAKPAAPKAVAKAGVGKAQNAGKPSAAVAAPKTAGASAPANKAAAPSDAEMAKKMQAIHDWMAKQEKLRAQKSAHAAGAK